MKAFGLAISLIMLLSANTVMAQCGASAVDIAPLPLGMCTGDTAIANFSASGNCTGSYEFQVQAGATVIQPWSTSSVFNATPAATTFYTVYARCNACPSTVVSDTFTVTVVQQPVISGITSICYNNNTTLTANPTANALGWYDSNGNQLTSSNTLVTPNLTDSVTYYFQISNTSASGTGTGSILITECGLSGFVPGADNDYVEISNLYNVPVNTAGWKVAISNSYSNINSVNPTIWNLPASFPSCSIQSKTDISGSANYWGQNILWNPNVNGWAIIIDNNGNVIDWVGWGWTAAQMATFNPTIAGFSITLGSQWGGPTCSNACGSTAAPLSISRVGSTDNNNSGDFVCQATSLNQLNPSLTCGWTTSTVACAFGTSILVDLPPTASNPLPINVECSADVPAADPLVVTDEADDNGTPAVTFLSEVSDGLSCPETITRTYRVMDSCSNYVDVTQTITIHDITPPVVDAAPASVTVQCSADIPAIVDLDWTDNCDGSGTVTGTEVSDGNTCPETITRTWTYSDNCGNSDTKTQTIIVNDTIPPTLDQAPSNISVQCDADVPVAVDLAWTDNCAGSGMVTANEVSDGNSCPETITRTWTITDDCGNSITRTQVIVVNDDTPPTAGNPPNGAFVTLPAPDPAVITDAADNCSTPTVSFWGDVSDGGFCPEHVTRTYRIFDDCGNETFVSQVLTIGDNIPVASFVPSHYELSNLDTEVDFTNTSIGATNYIWDFGDESILSNEFEPTHLFPDDESGGYVVTLIALTPLGCSDTVTVAIQVWEELIYYIPNTFTPDGDPFNQTFQPIFTSGYDPFNCHMWIYDRWGELIWESQNDKIGWDGTYGSDGRPVQQGVYTWKIEFKVEKNDERKMDSGHVTIIR